MPIEEENFIAGNVQKIEIIFDMVQVESSNIYRIGYNTEHRRLAINFKNNTTYHYQDVPPELHKEFMESPSKGVFLQSFIKNKFECWKFDENNALSVENKSCE